jgi:molybdopterin molybdotransferase
MNTTGKADSRISMLFHISPFFVTLYSILPEMIYFEEALKISLDVVFRTGTERVELAQAYGRILAEDVISDIDIPSFDKSAVDGYACRKADLQSELTVVEVIPAGKYPEKRIEPGQCSKIMTGAPLPEGADCVVMVENSKSVGTDKVCFEITKAQFNIRYRGEDVTAGMKLISSGVLINPGHIAVMASTGYAKPLVACKPRIGIISTGDELVEPSEIPNLSSIRNSNSYQLLAQVRAMGIDAAYLGIARDDEDTTLAFLNKALAENDVVLLTGGVSMGDFDHVPAMMKKAGLEVLFEKIAIQPGRPTVLARKENKLCFGLPGNPVSSFVLFELLVKPVLFAMMGHDFHPLHLRLPLGKSFKRKRADRLNVIPVQITPENKVIPVDYHGSAHIHAMVFTNGFIFIPLGVTEIKEGTPVDVRQI